jgi:hypothetical protein
VDEARYEPAARLEILARAQEGVITRVQALECGLTTAGVRAKLVTGRWQRIFSGVYATFSGPVPRRSLLWAAVLRAGPGAALSHETAAELVGLTDRPASSIHVTIPASRGATGPRGIVLHRNGAPYRGPHPGRTPPQTRIEETIVDLTQSARSVDEAIGWLAKAVGARLTTAERLAAALARRTRLLHGPVLRAAVADVGLGCHSLLELRYLRDVERAHRLPAGERQALAGSPAARRYDDVRYERYRLRVELDGRAAHPDHDRWRDMRRDNIGVVEGYRVLRYGLADVASRPCRVAEQVGVVLRATGWSGRPRRCGRPGCTANGIVQ